jgi:sugar/nucleoside kinase (ribokinase family)
LHKAARRGVVAGSLAVTRAGAQPSLPGRDEIDAALARLPRP